MQPTNPLQARGSFVKPESLTKSIAEHEVKKQEVPQPVQDPNPTPQEADPERLAAEQAVKNEMEARENTLKNFVSMCEKNLGLVLTDEDIRNYLFKGVLAKDVKISNVMSCTIQTMRTGDLQAIDQKMSEVREAGGFTQKGLVNEEAIITLAHAWTHANGKSLGATPSEREDRIRKMGSIFVESVADARINFETLIRIFINDADKIKK